MLFLVALLVHLGAIASLFPEVAQETMSLVDVIVIVQFPLMALATTALTIWDDEDDVLRSQMARHSLTFGITYICILIFATFGIAVGPADPFGAPASASMGMKVGWFVAFSIIASFGSRFFIAKSILEIAKSFGEAMKRAPALWYGLALAVGSAAGGGLVALMHSDFVVSLAAKAQGEMDQNPAPYVIAFLVVPLLLSGLARALRARGDS
jgi:hypothetical protein